MADVKLKSLKFPGLPNRYVIPTDAEDFTFENENLADVLQKKANIDGFYDELTAGSAEQLISSQFVEDSEPYKFRTTGGSADVGNREQVDAIVGGSIAWNQKVQNGNFDSASGWAGRNGNVSVSGNVITFTATATGTYSGLTADSSSDYAVPNHKYLMIADIESPVDAIMEFSFGGGGMASSRATALANKWVRCGAVWTPPVSTPNTYPANIYILAITEINSGQKIKFKNAQAFDLTQMFGSSVADAVYNMEQGNAGAGVKWLKSLFPNSYYAYNAGELVSVGGLQSHDTVGFNAWDEVWERGAYDVDDGTPYDANQIRSKNYIPVLSDTNYYIKANPYVWMMFFDENKNILTADLPNTGASAGNARGVGDQIFKTPIGCAFIKFYCQVSYGTTYNNDICINLSWSGWRNGEYEPYQKHSYPLDSSLTLRGVPKLSADNKMYYDGDEYLSDGSVTRKYKIVTYNGSENWGAESGGTYSGQNFFVEKPSDALPYSAGLDYAQKFLTAVAVSSDVLTDNTLVPSSGYFNFAIGARLGITSVADFKNYLSSNPISVLYPIAEPTTETEEPYAKVQTCDDFGTEEYVSTSIVPVGHNTEYPANLRDKLQHLPDLADNDGYYMIKQASKQMSLEPFRIPKAPSENGTYVLKATVSGGTPTYTWVEEN